jgi:hypothetical protein
MNTCIVQSVTVRLQRYVRREFSSILPTWSRRSCYKWSFQLYIVPIPAGFFEAHPQLHRTSIWWDG